MVGSFVAASFILKSCKSDSIFLQLQSKAVAKCAYAGGCKSVFAAKIRTSEGQTSHSYRRELSMEKLVTATNVNYAWKNLLQLQT